MMRRTLPILCAAALAALAAGCGGSSTPSTGFAAKADAVCRQTDQQFERIQATPPLTADQAEKQTMALIDVSEQALSDLKDLTPPSSDAEAYDSYLAARQQALDYLHAGLDAIQKRDGDAYARAKRSSAAHQSERLALARKAGLTRCARASKPQPPAGS